MKKFKKRRAKMEKVNISSPWITYWNKVYALFGQDPDITVMYNEDVNQISFYVQGTDKAEALEKLLPKEKKFGNITVMQRVIPANKTWDTPDLFRKIFEGNPLYADTIVVKPEGTSNPFGYVCFKKDVIQFWNDNLGDPHGNEFTLAQDIAREVFDSNGIYFTTESD